MKNSIPPYEAPHKCKDVSSHEYEMMVNVGQQEDINKYVCLHKCLCYINLSFYVKHIQHFDHTNFISWDNSYVSRVWNEKEQLETIKIC